MSVPEPVEDSWLRPSKVDGDRARVAYNVPYALDDAQKEHMKELVGDIRTLTFNASKYHDHPLSHCLTEISEDLVVRSFGKEPFVAFWGNQARHRRMGHVGAHVVSQRVVPHDWFRNRGQEEVVEGVDDFLKRRGHLQYRLFLVTHALYYMNLEDIAMLLGGNDNAEVHCIVHRHDKAHGRLNKGELVYSVDTDGVVTQRNPLTGFTYQHRTIEPLFHVDSCRVMNGMMGLTWDINKLAGDSYHVKFVLCRPDKCAQLSDPWELIKSDRKVVSEGDVTTYSCLGFKWYVYNSQAGTVVLEDVELFDRLRRMVAGKARVPRARDDLMAMCRRLANKNDIISIHQGYAHQIPPELMSDYVNAAFYCDVRHELETAIKYHRENKEAVEMLNKYLVEGVAPRDFSALAKVGRAVALPFATLGGLLHEHTVGARVRVMGGLDPCPLRFGAAIPQDAGQLVLDLNRQVASMVAHETAGRAPRRIDKQ
jgi:hypothetical protein